MDIVIKSFPDYPCPVCGKDLWAQVSSAAWQCQTCWPVKKYPPGFRVWSRSWKEVLNKVAKPQDFKEFNRRFLLAIQFYPPWLTKQLLRECREDIVLLGWERTLKKWAKFVELPKEGACPVCGSSFTIQEGEKILAIWRQEGRPAIPLSQGVRCLDLERFLSWPTNAKHVKAIKDWAARHQPVTLRGE